jgi:NCS1 family nucleobase:cation symporter-1
VDDLFTMDRGGRYWFSRGYNPNAVWATVLAGGPAILSVLVPKLVLDLELTTVDLTWIADYSWFIGCGLGFVAMVALERARPRISGLDRDLARATDGSTVAS